jgi:hypothetical protein
MLLALSSACSEPFEAGSADAQAGATGSDASNEGFSPANEAGSDRALSDETSLDADLPPPVAAGLLLWLRADAGVDASTGAVSSWADQSGHHVDARQTDPTMQPKWSSTALSERPAVVFDTDDFMSLPAGFADFTAGISMFAVVFTQTTTPCVDIVDFSNGPEIDDITLGRHDGKVHYEVSSNSLHGDDFPLGTPVLASLVHAPDSAVALRLNGAPFTTANFDVPASVTRLSNVVGRSLYADCGTLNGGIAEVLVYGRALANDERARVEDYLRARWSCCQ